MAFLDLGGRAFVPLLQITVLPYVAGSLIAGFGSMKREDARLLANVVPAVVVFSVLAGVALMARTPPERRSAASQRA